MRVQTRKYSSAMGAIRGATTQKPNPSRMAIVWSGTWTAHMQMLLAGTRTPVLHQTHCQFAGDVAVNDRAV